MSNRNDYVNGPTGMLITALSLVLLAALFLFALAAFAAVIFTILALIAWNEPLHLGKLTIQPEAARAFVLRGVAGTFLVPAFAVFASVILDFNIEPEVWPYLFLGGYTAGSIGVAIMMAGEEQVAPPPTQPTLPQPSPIPPPPEKPQAPRRPFDFADWDDDGVR